MKPNRGTKREAPKSNSSADDNNRQRGRPRIDARDQTAAERRRTQIRLAQRAYRERKETTISSLNRRVATLESIIAEMSSKFNDFETKARQSGSLNNQLADELNEISGIMTGLASRGAHESPEPDDIEQLPSPTEKILSAREAPNIPRRSTGQATVKEPAPLWGIGLDFGSSTSVEADTVQAEVNPPGGFSMPDWTATEAVQSTPAEASTYSGPGFGEQALGFWETPNTQAPQFMPNGSLGAESVPTNALDLQPWQQFNDSSEQYRVDVPEVPMPSKDAFSLDMPQELPLPKTCSYTESSFTRRLLRASLEASQRLMKKPSSNPDDVHRLCRFAYCFMKHETMLTFVESVMARTAKDNMELWNVPFFHIGGAGLHYPRDGIDASSKPPEWWANARPMGPRRELGPRFPVRDVPDWERIKYAGVTGEWFDSNDVDQYLRSKGLYIDSTTTVIELNEPLDSSLPGVHEMPSSTSATSTSFPDSGSGSDSPGNASLPWGPVRHGNIQSQAGGSSQFEQSNGQPAINLDMSPGPNIIDFDDSGPAFNFNMSTGFQPVQPVEEAKVKKLLDVDAFLESESNQAPYHLSGD